MLEIYFSSLLKLEKNPTMYVTDKFKWEKLNLLKQTNKKILFLK